MVVLDVAAFLGVDGLVDARVSHIDSNPLPESTRDCVSGMDPTISVEHIAGDIFGMNTINWIPHILSRGHN